MTALHIIFLVIASAAGTVTAWVLRNTTKSEFLNILLSFSGSYLLGVVVLHLLPDVFAEASDVNTGLYILTGFLIQLLIVQLTRGIEHGHMHLHEHLPKSYVFGVIAGLSVHAFMEGIPLSGTGITNYSSLYYGILVHKIPETFALATLLFFSLNKSWKAFLFAGLFACMTPIGSLFGQRLQDAGQSNLMLIFVTIVCGSLIHISTTIIFEASGKAHKISLIKFAAIVAGFTISLLTL